MTVAASVAFVAALIVAGIEPRIAAYAFDAAMGAISVKDRLNPCDVLMAAFRRIFA